MNRKNFFYHKRRVVLDYDFGHVDIVVGHVETSPCLIGDKSQTVDENSWRELDLVHV